jgi:hypothetical protein
MFLGIGRLAHPRPVHEHENVRAGEAAAVAAARQRRDGAHRVLVDLNLDAGGRPDVV